MDEMDLILLEIILASGGHVVAYGPSGQIAALILSSLDEEQ